MNADKHDSFPVFLKLFWTWLAVGVSQMSPLQVIQFIAGVFAILYSGLQIYKLVRELWCERQAKKGNRDA